MHCQPSYYFYYYKQDDLEKQNEFFCLISNKQSLWKSNRDKIYVLFNSYWIDSAFKWKLRFFHFILFNAKWTFMVFFCSFDLWECDGHAVSPRHNYFKISDNKKRESDGNDLNIFPTSPVLKLLNYKVCTRRIVMLIAGHVYTSLYPV